MKKFSRSAAAAAVLALGSGLAALAPSPSGAADARSAQVLAGQDLVKALRGGGYVVFLGHAETEPGQADVDLTVPGMCGMQRNLSAAGRRTAREIGAAFRTLGIRVDKVLASPLCRATETADLAFGRHDTSPALVSAMGLDRDERAAQSAEVRRTLATPPAIGTNVVLVSHNTTLKEATGIWPRREGDAHVFRPKAGGEFTHAGEIAVEEWRRIVGDPARARQAPEGT